MVHASEIVCFTCGQDAGEPPRLNRLESGKLCPACRERVLEALPPALPQEEPRPASEAPASGARTAEPYLFDPDEFDPGPRGA